MIYGIEYENSGWGDEDEMERAMERAAWDAKHDFPPTGDKALLYSDDQPACLIAPTGTAILKPRCSLCCVHTSWSVPIAAARAPQSRRTGCT
jgi:hypothetical protein